MTSDSIDFDIPVDRTEVPTLKFDGDTMQSLFGRADLWPSWVADMDFRAAPAVIEALQRRADHGVFGYEPTRVELADAVAAWYADRHGWHFRADRIVHTPRTLNSLAVLIDLFSGDGDGVIVQPPVFYDFKLLIRAAGRRMVKNPLKLGNDGYEMDFDQLEQVVTDERNSLLILCNPHNPIGRAWHERDLSILLEICRDNGVFVIADEIHGDLCYGRRYTPLASVAADAARHCATCLSPVKSFNLAGVAGSMIVIEDDDHFARCRHWYDRFEIGKNFVFDTAATLAAYRDGGDWLDRVNDYLRENVAVVRQKLARDVPGVRLVEPDGTFLLWFDFRELGLGADELADFLVRDAGIAANPGHWFGREGVGFARINIACPRARLQAALAQLESAVKAL